MTDGVGIVGAGTGSVSTPVAVAPAATGSSSAHFSASNAATQTPASFNNPVVILDPTAGYITEYLSANGSQIVSQTPSAVTVAYLQQGLSADGSPKASAVTTTA